MTEKKKNIPELRFPEFDGEWISKKIKDISTVSSGATPLRTKYKYYNSGNINWVKTTDLNNSQIFKTEEKVTDVAIQETSLKIFPINSVLIAMYGGFNQIGRTGILKVESATNQALSVIQLDQDTVYPDYLLMLFNAKVKKWKRIAGSSRKDPNITSSDVKNFKIEFPSIREQQKIASFLTSVDERIQQLTKKKELLEKYKKGIMQKLFSQQIRFKDDDGNDFPDWDISIIGELCKITTGKLDANAMVDNGKYRFYTCAKEYYFINEYTFDTEALLVSGNGANVGYIHYYKGKFNAYQRTYILHKFNENIIFIKYYLERYLGKRIINEKNDGNTPYIVLSTLSEMKISMPRSGEQQKIANYLSSIDKKIESVEKQLEKTKEFKKGLLQKMFV